MKVIEQLRPQPMPLPGIAHATWAGTAEGLDQISVWRQTMAPGAATPPHRHDCDEVVLCLAGCGELLIDGEVHRFGADCTLILPKGREHQFVNSGRMPMETIGIFGRSPVGTFAPDGQALVLPWRT